MTRKKQEEKVPKNQHKAYCKFSVVVVEGYFYKIS